jgi:hypothetical protein
MDHAEQARTLADAVSKRNRGHTSEDADAITDALLSVTRALLAIHDRMEDLTPSAQAKAPRPRWLRGRPRR